MMPDEAAAAETLAALFHAAFYGGIVVALAWAVTRACRRRAPAALCALVWWFACLKLVLLLVPVAVLPGAERFALLIRHHEAARIAGAARRHAPAAVAVLPLPQSPAAAPIPATAVTPPLPGGEKETDADRTLARVPAAMTRPNIDAAGALRIVGVALWLAGVLTVALTGWRRASALRRSLHSAVLLPNDAPLARCAEELRRRFRLRHTPGVWLSPAGAPGPLVTRGPLGSRRARVYVPADLAARLSPEDARLLLAHELAHLRRGDLWLSVVPALTGALLWFLPWARLAVREWEAAREEACDAAALRVCGGGGADPARYGRLLLNVLERARRTTLSDTAHALGMAAAPDRIALLRRRLTALPVHARTEGGSRLTLLVRRTALPLGAAALLLPWRLGLAGASPLPAVPTLTDEDTEPLPRYKVTDLGTLGGKQSWAAAVAEDGTVVGAANVYPLGVRGHAFVRSGGPAGAAARDIGTGWPFRHSVAAAIGENRIVGWAYNRASRPVAVAWSADGTNRRYLSGLGGAWRYAQAIGLNDRGDAVGAVRAVGLSGQVSRVRAVLWTPGTANPVPLPSLGGPFSQAYAINDAGVIVGKADLSGPDPDGPALRPTHAVRWDASGRPDDLGTLPGGTNSLAYAINDAGDVVGFSETGEGVARAFLRGSEDAAPRDLGTLADGGASVAYGIARDRRLIVGAATKGPAVNSGRAEDVLETRAVVWQGGKAGSAPRLRDLNELIPPDSGWTLAVARGVNWRGQIVGQGFYRGKRRAFLLTPITNVKIKR
jgi:probable HAF family extracellular repeat protein